MRVFTTFEKQLISFDSRELAILDVYEKDSQNAVYSNRMSFSKSEDRVQAISKLKYLQHMKEVITVTSISYKSYVCSTNIPNFNLVQQTLQIAIFFVQQTKQISIMVEGRLISSPNGFSSVISALSSSHNTTTSKYLEQDCFFPDSLQASTSVRSVFCLFGYTSPRPLCPTMNSLYKQSSPQ